MYVVEFPSIVVRPVSEICIEANGNKVKCLALWDTGSNRTIISPTLAANLELQPCGRFVGSRVGGSVKGIDYKANIYIGDDIYFANMPISSILKEWPDHLIMIGMDVISQGTLTIDNSRGYTVLSFSI